jgi:hypothetical protein
MHSSFFRDHLNWRPAGATRESMAKSVCRAGMPLVHVVCCAPLGST